MKLITFSTNYKVFNSFKHHNVNQIKHNMVFNQFYKYISLVINNTKKQISHYCMLEQYITNKL